MEKNHDARQFIREFLMYRYSRLLQSIEKHYSITEEQKILIYKTILNVNWINQVFADADTN